MSVKSKIVAFAQSGHLKNGIQTHLLHYNSMKKVNPIPKLSQSPLHKLMIVPHIFPKALINNYAN